VDDKQERGAEARECVIERAKQREIERQKERKKKKE